MIIRSRNRWLAIVYAATIFVSAFLLFQIQPMISKAILPWFGGTPAVWTICLLFFQSLLFAGYAYAHFTNAWLRPRQQALLHILVLLAALALLRVLPDARLQPLGDAEPTRAILGILAITIGLPYFVLSATGPLLQAWFARSFPGRTPYRLYALSNVGSLLALLSFPFLFERQFDLSQQAQLWSAGFIAFALLCACAAWRLTRVAGVEAEPSPQIEAIAGIETSADSELVDVGQAMPEISSTSQAQPDLPESPEPTTSEYLLWLILPAFASIVLMATTNHISTDVAVVPFLWVVPLSLYLLTFIIAFDRPAWYRPVLTAVLTLAAIYPTSAMYKKNNVGTLKLYDCGMTGRCARAVADFFTSADTAQAESASDGPQVKIGFRSALFMNFAAMFGICMLCHGQLARLKPPSRYLTAYYLMIAAGGALGGIAVSLIAPHVFNTIFEWQLAIAAAAIGAVGILLFAIVSRAIVPDLERPQPQKSVLARRVARVLLVVLLIPVSLMLLDLIEFLFSPHKGSVYETRNFFGALTIRENSPNDPPVNEFVLLNGTTLHGSQFTSPDRRGQPTSYYGTPSGVGQVLNYFRANPPPGGIRIGDVGLGAGTLAAYTTKHDHICFYEINPTVIDIATSGKWFTYVTDARARGAHDDIKLGDARLSLQREVASNSPPRSGEGPGEGLLPYHVLVLDAFSGDAVPTHLLTAEAMDIYRQRLATQANMDVDGALLIHVSNRYLDLERVVRGAAKHLGFDYLQFRSPSVDSQSLNSADWVVLTRNKNLLSALAPKASQPPSADKPPVLWTDAHSSLFEILR